MKSSQSRNKETVRQEFKQELQEFGAMLMKALVAPASSRRTA
ncbi:hypothetical protein O9992_02380 [Vibrio lentus]|nr:hypothetical protein [Vibrio lentus]